MAVAILLVFLHGLLIVRAAADEVFLEQPGPGPIMAPIGTQVQLNCSVMEGYRIVWNIRPPGRTALISTDQSSVLADLAGKGIAVENPTDTISLLVINATETNNNTGAICVAVDREDPSSREGSTEVQVIFVVDAATSPPLTATSFTTPSSPVETAGKLSSGETDPTAIIASVIVVAILCTLVAIVVVGVVIFRRHNTKTHSVEKSSTSDNLPPVTNTNLSVEKSSPCPTTSDGLPTVKFQDYKVLYHICDRKVMHAKKIALEKNDPADGNDVAIKMLEDFKAITAQEQMDAYKAMPLLQHSNVIQLLGLGVADTSIHFIVMEFMNKKNLNQLLKKNYEDIVEEKCSNDVQIKKSTLIDICKQIASGMEYLASMNFVHGDLATRNCLVSGNFCIKIADFRMSQILRKNFYKVDKITDLPLHWMATECFHPDGVFSSKTDVWAFGVTMWEVFTLAKEKPYCEWCEQELEKDIKKGPERQLLFLPGRGHDDVYSIMLECWKHDPNDRVTFEEVHISLLAMLD